MQFDVYKKEYLFNPTEENADYTAIEELDLSDDARHILKDERIEVINI